MHDAWLVDRPLTHRQVRAQADALVENEGHPAETDRLAGMIMSDILGKDQFIIELAGNRS